MPDNIVEQFESMRDRDEEDRRRSIEVAERTFYQSLFSGVVAFETDPGLVMIDTGTQDGSPILNDMLRDQTSKPVHTIILTHGHVDHAFGAHNFLNEGQSEPRIIAHEAMTERFERYRRTSSHNTTINARQFKGDASGSLREGQGPDEEIFGPPTLGPNTYYEDSMTLSVGELTFEVNHCKGETDDHSWVYCRERDVLCPGDLFISVLPNAGNPQKVQRYPWKWADGLRKMASKNSSTLCPGHGDPVIDAPELIEQMLLETAEFLETIVDRTIEVLNDGSPPHTDIVNRVEIPESDSPWLQPLYDEAEFIIRNVIRYFGGWWTGRPSELKPAPRQELARELANLSEGVESLAQRARDLADSGRLDVACHLADYALEADPDNKTVREAVVDVYEQRRDQAKSLMARNLYESAVEYAKNGEPFR